MRPTRIRDKKMAFHYSDGSYVGGFPAFIGGLFGIAICFGLHSAGLNFFLSILLGAAIPIGVMALINLSPPQNYSNDIIGKWRDSDDSIKHSKEEPIYSWEFKNDGTMIWDYGSCRTTYNYEIKGKFIVIEGEKKFKIESLWEKMLLTVVDCNSSRRYQLKYYGYY